MNFFKNIIDLEDDIYTKQISNFRHNSFLRNGLIISMILFYFIVSFIISNNPESIKHFGFKQDDLTISGLILSNFMHSGILHLIFNMWALFFIINRMFFISVYKIIHLILLGCVGSISLSSIYLSSNQVLLGSSGFIFALFSFFGFYLYDLKNRYKMDNRSINAFLTINGALLFGISFLPNVAWFAHLGGFIIGMIYYYIVRKNLDYDFLNYTILIKKV